MALRTRALALTPPLPPHRLLILSFPFPFPPILFMLMVANTCCRNLPHRLKQSPRSRRKRRPRPRQRPQSTRDQQVGRCRAEEGMLLDEQPLHQHRSLLTRELFGAGCFCITHALAGAKRKGPIGRSGTTIQCATRVTQMPNWRPGSRSLLRLLCVSVCFCSAKGVGVSAWFCTLRRVGLIWFGLVAVMR